MQPNDDNTGHCMSPTVSGAFIMFTRNGTLVTVCDMIQERGKIAAELEKIEQQLLSCNNPLALACYARWCEIRKKDFSISLKELAEKLETQKLDLRQALQQIDEQLAQLNGASEWTITPQFVSLTPMAATSPDPVMALRQMIIDQNLGKPHFEICKLLDFPWREGEAPAGFFPDSWSRKYGVKTFVAAYHHADCRKLVEPMISKRKQRGP